MTSAITVRSLQRRGISTFSVCTGWRTALLSICLHRGTSVPCGPVPSVIRVCSSPMALEPLPYRQGSMWVSWVGWIDDVIATPWVRSRSGLTFSDCAPTIDSELVRVNIPNRSEIRRVPSSRILNNSFWVP